MSDLRTQLPECPLGYQIPYIPASHTALVIEITAADIDWQERMLPWTLAGLINNTDLVMKGVHLYVVCEDGTQDRIKTALKKFDWYPPGNPIRYLSDQGSRLDDKSALVLDDSKPLMLFEEHGVIYDSVCLFDINYWALRGVTKSQDRIDIKLPFGHVLQQTWGWAAADYSLHAVNEIYLKDTWIPMALPTFRGDLHENREDIREYIGGASARARWLHDANTAVYGEDYKKQNKNVAAYFFNEADPNWHLDASILHYSAFEVNNPHFAEWAPEWQHLGTEALIALYLLKTGQHAYNFSDSIMIEYSYSREDYSRLCNMQHATVEQFRSAIKELLGSQLNLSMN